MHVLQYQITLQTHVSQRNVSGNVQIEELTDYAIRVEDLRFAEDFGCDDELVEYFTNFFNLIQTQSDTRLNIKEAVSFGLIRKKADICRVIFLQIVRFERNIRQD